MRYPAPPRSDAGESLADACDAGRLQAGDVPWDAGPPREGDVVEDVAGRDGDATAVERLCG